MSIVLAALPFAQRKGRPRRVALALGLVVLAALAFPGSTEATSFNQIKKLLASDAEAGDTFGYSVAVSGDTAVVGAAREVPGGFGAAAVYVFERNEGGADNWGEVKKLIASDSQHYIQYGISVAISSDTAVVGAPEYFGGGQPSAAYVFQRNNGGADNWGEVKKLTASVAQPIDYYNEQFGWSVAVSGETVIVSARLDNDGSGHAGAVYVFERNEGGADNWGEVKKLIASDSQNFVQFGWRVALSGDTAVVGAPFQVDGGIFQAGAAFLFERNEGGADNWGEVKKLTAPDAQEHDWFGFGVAVSGAAAVVGAPREDAGGSNAGAAYVFERVQGGGGNWGEVTKLTASDAGADDNFGFSVAASGAAAVVGAPREDVGGADAGTAYVFQRNEGGADNWGEVTKLTASDAQAIDQFGGSVAVSGDHAVVGAALEDAGGTDAGAAYVFDLALPKPTATATATATPTVTPTPTDTPPGPVGGISLDSGLRPLPLETSQSISPPWVAVGIVAAACLLALGGAAWYVRRRRRSA